MGGRWKPFRNLARFAAAGKSGFTPTTFPLFHPSPTTSAKQRFCLSQFSSIPSAAATIYADESDSRFLDFDTRVQTQDEEAAETLKIPIKAYFPCTSINLKSLQAENSSNVVPASFRSSNHIALRFGKFPLNCLGLENNNISCSIYMVVFQYGSIIMFNVEDHEVECYLNVVRRHSSGLLPEMKKDDYMVKEKPKLTADMKGGSDHIILRSLDIDSVRIIGSVLGQSIALDYFVSQVDGILEEFTDINRVMEKTGTFVMDRRKLFQLMGKANSSLADVILKVGLFERSEIAWRDAKYAEIYEYLREEYEITQRFGNLNYKLKFVEHNIHFLQEILQNRRSDLLEWCIIFLLTIENVISVYEIVRESTSGSV
ncbi:protein RETARDED ROOT GROWTH, mitochondrial [Impatiens glandulifera]|uniref:protein RETARDED ROOT GROWTH, mitochondrial n=1 Tax=Impatiens glandulifera TaxID=253017 RepID=UPI001FB10F1A|nr:protein RETARDED ROOT GROWTH, mitochondrial [Impatiens glandulifera]